MKNYKIYLKTYLKTFIIMLIYTLIISTFHYFNIFNITVSRIILFVLTALLFIYSSLNISRNIRKKGYLNGIINGTILIILFLLLSLIFKEQLTLKTILYYVLLLISSVAGGIIGINLKEFENN